MKMEGNAMKQQKIKELVAQLTLEEKAGLCSGNDNWFTKAVERLGIPAIRTSDGPHGLRTQSGDENSLAEETTAPAVCFPAACTTAASFNRELLTKMGAALGREAQSLGVHVLLGPGVNIKRSPLCGRNFEYFSEDPFVAGELGTAFVNGVQSEGVGTSLKHFFANSQEHRRMDVSSEADERTLREIYLTAFETVVKKAKPWTIMASYNKVNGIYSTANKAYLKDVLRGEWGYDGLVMSDWGATHDRAGAVEADCALTMPAASETDHEIVDAVKEGRLDEAALDEACEQLLTLAFRATKNHREGVVFDFDADHSLVKEIAAESAVLLKNDDDILPLSGSQKVAFIGGFAKKPRFQGGGSSHINSKKVVSAVEAAEAAGYVVTYAAGYPEDGMNVDDALLAEAVETARDADVAVVFAGLTDAMETEGVDRRHMNMPVAHDRLIEAVCAVNPKTVIVLHNGAPVEMPWVEQPKAILEAYLGGEAVGEAVVDLLYGKANPSGHLAETFPKTLADNPSFLFYFGEHDKVYYSERYYVGYRYYTSKQLAPLFPFGHGLSYTSFAYRNLTLDRKEMDDTETLTVSVEVENTGAVGGKALIQLYVAPPNGELLRPTRELKGFEKVALAPGEKKAVAFTLEKRAFAHWSEEMHDWRTESGSYSIEICENADTVLLAEQVQVRGTQPLRRIVYSDGMAIGDFAECREGHKFVDENIGYMVHGMASQGLLPAEAVGALQAMGGGKIGLDAIEMLAQRIGMTAAGGGGVSVLFAQPLSILASFLPEENEQELKELINTLNSEK